MTTSAGMELAKRLQFLVSLNDPKNGGPYGGYAAQQCIEAMREAAAFLSHPVDTGQGVGEEMRALVEARYLEVHGDYMSEEDWLLFEDLYAAARPPLASVEGADANMREHLRGLLLSILDDEQHQALERYERALFAAMENAAELSRRIQATLAQSGRSGAETVAGLTEKIKSLDGDDPKQPLWRRLMPFTGFAGSYRNSSGLSDIMQSDGFTVADVRAAAQAGELARLIPEILSALATPPVGRQEPVATEPVAWRVVNPRTPRSPTLFDKESEANFWVDIWQKRDGILDVKKEALYLATPPVGRQEAVVKTMPEIIGYEVLGTGKMQTEAWADTAQYHPIGAVSVDKRDVIVYRSLADGNIWVIPREEFDESGLSAVTPPIAGAGEELVERLKAAEKILSMAIGSASGTRAPIHITRARQVASAITEAAAAIRSRSFHSPKEPGPAGGGE
jgi:hypothetical protein